MIPGLIMFGKFEWSSHENVDFMQKNLTAISFHFESAVVSKQQYFCPDIVIVVDIVPKIC